MSRSFFQLPAGPSYALRNVHAPACLVGDGTGLLPLDLLIEHSRIGVTVLHEMRAAGLRVAIAGDNVRDPFYAYGDHDVLETFAHAVKILHLDHPFGDWAAAVTATPAAIMGLAGRGTIRVGGDADLVVLKARSYGEMLARNQSDRMVIRAGRAIDTTPPDYALLDDL